MDYYEIYVKQVVELWTGKRTLLNERQVIKKLICLSYSNMYDILACFLDVKKVFTIVDRNSKYCKKSLFIE